MNSINRAGQRVICVQHPDVWQAFCCGLSWPALDAVYTVSGFGTIEDHPGIYLRELTPVACSCHQLSAAPWPMEIFRPMDQRHTDIGELTKILDQTPTLLVCDQ
jgi:hypothetical protein